MRTFIFLIAAGVLWLSSAVRPAQAVEICTPTGSDMTFGAYDPITDTAVDASSTIQIACTGMVPLTSYDFCVSMESGSVFTGNQRQLLSGSDRMNYDIYTDAARTNDWGSYRTGYGVTGVGSHVVRTTGLSPIYSFTLTYYGRVAANQSTLPPSASYSSSFNTAGLRPSVRWGLAALGLGCSLIVTEAISATSFTITGSVDKNCTVSAATLDFGSPSSFAANVDATSTISVRCTNTTPYTVGLDAGTGSGATLTNRKMTLNGTTINYTMYTDAARTTNWGTASVSATGTGLTQAHTVYGRVFSGQPLPTPGTYTDTITTTVTF